MRNLNSVLDHARHIFGDDDTAQEWLNHFSATLDAKPVELLKSDEGAARVMLHLNGISRHRES